MGYYEVLEEIERLQNSGIKKIRAVDIANSLDLNERGVKRCIAQLLSDDLITRIVINDKQKETYYVVKKGDKTEGFINGVFKVVVNLIR